MTFNTKKYNATRKRVLKFLEKNPESSQSIVLHGKDGTGKSRMLNELQLDFEHASHHEVGGAADDGQGNTGGDAPGIFSVA